MNVEQLEDLRQRVLAASGPSQDLDRQLTLVFGHTGPNGVPSCAGILGIAPFTRSIDAALALVERVLPGWCWGVDQLDGEHHAYVGAPAIDDETSMNWAVQGKAETPPLAILSALLSALIVKAEA